MPEGNTPAPARAEAISRADKLNVRAAGVVGLAVLCSRVLGLAREQIFAALFGGGRVMDAFTIAFRIPNLLRDLFAEGALSTAFVTVFTRTAAVQDGAAAWRLANKVATLAGRAQRDHAARDPLRSVAGRAARPRLRSRQGGTHRDADAGHVAVHPAGIARRARHGDAERASNVFGMPAMASSFFNLGSIVAGVVLGYWLDPHFGPRAIVGLAIGTLIGGGLQLAVQLPALAREGYRFRPDLRWHDPGVRAVLRSWARRSSPRAPRR